MTKHSIQDQTQIAERILRSIPTDQADAIRSRFGALGIELVARCAQCDRALDQPDDPLSAWSRGECAACVVEFETGKPPPDLAPDELRAYVQPYLTADRELGRMIDQAFAEAGPGIKHDIQERMIIAASQRLIRDGKTPAEARAHAIETLHRPMPPGFPTIDKLDEP